MWRERERVSEWVNCSERERERKRLINKESGERESEWESQRERERERDDFSQLMSVCIFRLWLKPLCFTPLMKVFDFTND